MSEYVEAAAQALSTDGGDAALESLGYWDLLGHLDDLDCRTAVFALFRAQGRTLGASGALGGLLAQPYLPYCALPTEGVVASVGRQSTHRGLVQMVVGDLGDRHLIVDRPGLGASIVPPDAVLPGRPVAVPGRLALREVDIDWERARTFVGEDDVAEARARSLFLGRLAIAAEILGAAEAAVALAVEHASHREQFGQPIGRFQAVRHLLAWASTDCVAIEAMVNKGVALDESAPPRYDEVVKALAGRNGRKACERSLQVLGGIGFTAEHHHHHHHSRVLALDTLLGTSAHLTRQLGTWLRTSGTEERFARTFLVPHTG